MKKILIILKEDIRIHLWMSLFLMLILVLTGQVLAQKDPEAGSQPYKINGKEVKEYLIEKYKLRKDDVTSEIKQTPNGPSGKVLLRGEIKPQNVVITENTMQGRSRAIAKAFFTEEAASLFGITNIDEIREYSLAKDLIGQPGWTGLYYQRYIDDLPLNGSLFQVFIKPDGTINSINAYLVPPPSELFDAVKKKTLTEIEIRKIVEDDLKTEMQRIIGDPQYGNFDPKDIRPEIVRVRKAAISEPPYIIWGVAASVVRKVNGKFGVDKIGLGSWHFSIDAFTGEILAKRDSRIIN